MHYEYLENPQTLLWKDRCKQLEAQMDAMEQAHMAFICCQSERRESDIRKLVEQNTELEVRLKEHRDDMETFNRLPWYEKICFKFDLENM